MKPNPPRVAAWMAALLLVPAGPLPLDAAGRGGQNQQNRSGGGNQNANRSTSSAMGGRMGAGSPRVTTPRPSAAPRPVAKAPSQNRGSSPNRSGGASPQRNHAPQVSKPSISKPSSSKPVSRPSSSVVSRGFSVPNPVSRPSVKPAPKPAAKPASKPASKPSPSIVSRGYSVPAPVSRPGAKPDVKPASKPSPKPAVNLARKPDGGGSGGNHNPSGNRNDGKNRPPAAQGGNARATNSVIAPSGSSANRPGGGGNVAANQKNQGGGGNRGGGGGGASKASKPSRITTLANRSTYHNPRAGVYGVSAGGGGAGGGRHVSGSIHHGGGSAGGGAAHGYGVWRHVYDAPYRSHYVHPAFCHSVNYAYRPSLWGYRPWWGARYSYSWHSGCWDYGWNRHWSTRYSYYRRPALYYPPGYGTYYAAPSTFVPWGLACWTLGRLAYDTGYYSYYNPYVAPPVSTSTTIIRYAEPITVVAANNEPVSEEAANTAAEKASAAMDRAREAFLAGDYVAASNAVDDAISHAPGDQVLHEFRALTLFALGRYAEATGVLHSVLASGPGWTWETMIGFYGEPDRYTEQFRRLEDHVVANPGSAEVHFLLGYHYLVGENLVEAEAMFAKAAELQPSDTVSRQLESLLAESGSASGAEADPEVEEKTPAMVEAPPKAPVAAEALHGIWKAPSAEGKTITLSLTEIGTFSWNYEGASGEVLSGEWSLDEDGLLVLSAEDVQMVGDITLNEDGTLHFLLAGSPEDDPGLTFGKE